MVVELPTLGLRPVDEGELVIFVHAFLLPACSGVFAPDRLCPVTAQLA
jgi:hypothetical protein